MTCHAGHDSAIPLFVLIHLGTGLIKLFKVSTKNSPNHRDECRMVLETRKQLMAWMELRLQISFRRFALSIEDKMLN